MSSLMRHKQKNTKLFNKSIKTCYWDRQTNRIIISIDDLFLEFDSKILWKEISNLSILSNLNKFPGFTIAALNPRHTTWILLKALSRRFFQIQVCHGRRSCRRRHYHRMLLKSELIWIGRINHYHLNCLTIGITHKTFLDFIGISGKLQKA